jgi:hypothetical protein
MPEQYSQPESTIAVPPLRSDEPAVTIEISKVGGGVPGRRYTSLWSGALTSAGREVERISKLNIPTQCTHEEAARHLARFLSADHCLDGRLRDRLDAWAQQSAT